MRKIKSVRSSTPSPKISENEVIFFGIMAVCKKAVEDYNYLLKNSKTFYFNEIGKFNPNLIIQDILNKLSEIINQSVKRSWDDIEVIKVRNRLSKYFNVIEETIQLVTRKDILDYGVYIEDYEFLSTLVNTREFIMEEKDLEYVSQEIRDIVKELIPKISEIIDFILKEIYFGKLPNAKDYKTETIEIEVLINDEGKLLNKKGFYSRFEIFDYDGIKYCAGLTKEGQLVVLESSEQEWIINSKGNRLEWRTSIIRKENELNSVYRIGAHEVLSNIRKNKLEALIKEVNYAGIENIEIIKTLIGMKGYYVKRD